MKRYSRIIAFFLSVCLLLCACAKIENGADGNSTQLVSGGVSEENSMDDQIGLLLENSLSKNLNLIAIHHPIEESYLAELDEANDTGSFIQLYTKYQELWKEEAGKYQELITNELDFSVEASNAFSESVDAWNAALSKEIDTYVLIQIELHGEASILGQKVARHSMRLYREQALNAIFIYDEVMEGRGWSWHSQTW